MDYRLTCLVAALGLTLAGCSDSLHEDTTGYVDLLSFYKSSGTTADPTAGIPKQIAPSRGWINGARVEYYDFGSVTLPRKSGTRGEALRVPDNASVGEIYFFYDQQHRPLFSKPAFDPRANTWVMPGGEHALDPAPIATPGDEASKQAYFASPYVARPRAELFDDERGTSSYQRPVIDLLPGDSDYNGLWEIVEITVNDSDYKVDDVKSQERVQEGLDDGRLASRHTGFVINCPVVDERTAVLPSTMNNNVPRPRIELWYRTKLGICFLANGWESLGETTDQNVAASDRANLRLFHANEVPASRINTFDVISETVGDETRLTGTVAKLYTPATTTTQNTPNMDRTRTPFPNDDLGTALPRRTAADPGGYSPIVWLWDIRIPEGGPVYVPGTYRNVAELAVPPDPFPPANPTLGGSVEALNGGTTVASKNVAVIGPATKCVDDSVCKFGQTCNMMPDVNMATSDPPAGQNIADVVIQREGGPRCDAPVADFGGYCAPGVSRCDVQAPAGSENEKALKALGVATAGPTFTVHADLAAADKKLSDLTLQSMGTDPVTMMPITDPAVIMAATAALPAAQTARDKAADKAKYYDDLGFTKGLNGWGYLCYPGATAQGFGPGFCEIRCDSTQSGTVTEVKSTISVPGQGDFEYTFRTEPRCGGTNMLGYRCLPSGTVAERQRVCVRECNRQANTSATYYVDDPAPTLAFNQALCAHPINLKMSGTDPSTAFKLSGGLPAMTAIQGQDCVASSLSVANQGATTVRACLWNVDMVPRDPDVFPGKP